MLVTRDQSSLAAKMMQVTEALSVYVREAACVLCVVCVLCMRIVYAYCARVYAYGMFTACAGCGGRCVDPLELCRGSCTLSSHHTPSKLASSPDGCGVLTNKASTLCVRWQCVALCDLLVLML